MGEAFKTIGHDQPKTWLANAVRGGRVNGSYLFLGPSGIGKSAVAREFAAALLCESPAEGHACGVCGQCGRVARGLHPNVRTFEKPSDKAFFPVELVREICGASSLSRVEPGFRIFIVDDADRFNDSSANAFLKTLEEPPEGTVFILLAASGAQMHETIVSRCQAVRFSALTSEQVAAAVSSVEGIPADAKLRRALIDASAGSPGRVVKMLESGAPEAAADFAGRAIDDPFGAAEQLVGEVSKEADNEARREAPRDVVGLLLVELRRQLADQVAEGGTPGKVVSAVRRLDQLRERIDGNVNLKLCCDSLALAWPG